MRIELCDQTLVKKYPLGVATVLDVVGHPEALVTDESMLGDFIAGSDDTYIIMQLSRMVGRQLEFSSYVWQVGKWLEGGV